MADEVSLLVKAIGEDCRFCGFEMESGPLSPRRPTKEHLFPYCMGGRLHGENRQVICWQCNNDKGNKTAIQFLIDLIRQGDDRGGYLADFLIEIYASKPAEEADALVGMPGSPPPAILQRKGHALRGTRCMFPACACARQCQFAP